VNSAQKLSAARLGLKSLPAFQSSDNLSQNGSDHLFVTIFKQKVHFFQGGIQKLAIDKV
jgi:hypothetical protein